MPQPANVIAYWANQSRMRNIVITDGGSMTAPETTPASSPTSPAIVTGNTIATSNFGVTRVTPAAAVTGIVLQTGDIDGQVITVLNQGAIGSTISFDTDATSNVARGLSVTIPGLSHMRFVWYGTRWYPRFDLNGATSATAVAILDNATVATVGLKVSRIAPAAARTGIILESGTYDTQEIIVVNESAAASTATMAAQATSHVADGVSSVIAGLTAHKYVWSNGLWYHQK